MEDEEEWVEKRETQKHGERERGGGLGGGKGGGGGFSYNGTGPAGVSDPGRGKPPRAKVGRRR